MNDTFRYDEMEFILSTNEANARFGGRKNNEAIALKQTREILQKRDDKRKARFLEDRAS
jgi:hypothetical protein